MGGRKIRRRSRIECDIPAEVREELHRVLLEGATYDETADFLRARGHDISRSAVGRYGKQFFEAYQGLKRFEDQARAVASGADDGMPMEEAVGKLLLKKVFEALVEGSVDVTSQSRLLGEVSRLQQAHIGIAKFKGQLEKRAAKAAAKVTRMAEGGGLSAETIAKIEREVLGIVR